MGVVVTITGMIISILIPMLVHMLRVVPPIAPVAAGESHSCDDDECHRGRFVIFHSIVSLEILRRSKEHHRIGGG